MTIQYDPRRLLKQIPNTLLKLFFDSHGGLEGIDWDSLGEHDVDPVIEAIAQLPEGRGKAIQVALHDIHDLSDETGFGTRSLAEEIQRQLPERAGEFEAMTGRAERAMWTLVNAPQAFQLARLVADADMKSTGRYWVTTNSLPKKPIDATPELRDALAMRVAAFFQNKELRGRHFCVHAHERAGGAQYFFVRLADYPDAPLVFGPDGKERRGEEWRTFEVVFVHCPADGTLSMYAQGGQPVYEALQRIFCETVLEMKAVRFERKRRTYRLDHLLWPERNLRTATDDRVATVEITSVRLRPLGTNGDEDIILNVPAGESLDETLRKRLNPVETPLRSLRLHGARFRLTFLPEAGKTPKTFTFGVGGPNSCDLKGARDERRIIGERCLRLWGVTDA